MFRSSDLGGRGLGLAALLLVLCGCGRTPSPTDPCADGQCPCVFDSDCPQDNVCVDNVCIGVEDYLECITRGPEPETCNGRDDDCDGLVDESLGTPPCARTAGDATCAGVEVCGGRAGWVCDAPLPADEICDGVDNDCDGVVDGPWTNTAGQYVSDEHCGSCGATCASLIPDALATECVLEESGPRCRVVECPEGSYPDETQSTCLTLPDALCLPCTRDDQCLGPNARCLDLGNDEGACGRDCSPTSPYGERCPAGFACVDDQCRPSSGTCLCTPTNLGVTRSCLIDTCDGFETCEATGGGGAGWSACDISSHRETCDGLDNDCDGQIDDGFLDPNTGRYESDLHCGVCNNDCTRRWSAEVDHAIGGCDVSSGSPECRITQCTSQVIGGQAFEWVDVDGRPENGCECRRRQGNLDTDPPDLGTFAGLSLGVEDENCDGIDGVVSDAIFVSASAAAGGDGSRARPFDRITDALNAFPGSGRIYILVAEGVYRERVPLFEGVQLFGGYSGDFSRRDVLGLATIIQSPTLAGSGPDETVSAVGLGHGRTRTVLAGFYVYGLDRPGATTSSGAGRTSTAIVVADSGPNLTVQNNVIRGGRGGDGGRGEAGSAGFGRDESPALDGEAGADGARITGVCSGASVAGGAGGDNPACAVASGRSGGSSGCPTFDIDVTPTRGGRAEFQNPTGGDGAGGFHWSFDALSGRRCGHVTESGFPSNIQSNNGSDGADGADGPSGTNGEGCSAAFGSFSGASWTGGRATPAQGGGDGSFGGGGGAGGGTAAFQRGVNSCQAYEIGSTGGGGGAGGCGGAGGDEGGAGGASIAVHVLGPRNGAEIIDNRIVRGLGGRGGDGGFGGAGGRGGAGGFGGGPNSWSGSSAGKGGDGGNGGPGGSGGGGCGGASFGLLSFAIPDVPFESVNEFTVPNGASTGGAAGQGGTPGSVGGSANVLQLRPCGPGAACPAGRTCDANQVCMPN